MTDASGIAARARSRTGALVRARRALADSPAATGVAERVLVVKLGGTTIADQAQVLDEVAAVARRRPVVLVHGGGKRISEWLERLGVPSKFEGGLRVTDAQSLEVAAAVLRGVVNSELVSGLRDLGVDAVGLSGVDGGLLIAERIPKLGPRRERRRPASRPARRDPRRRPGAGRGARSPATRTASSATSTPTTSRPGSPPVWVPASSSC